VHVTGKQVREKVKALGEIINQYNLMRKEDKKDWRTYEELQKDPRWNEAVRVLDRGSHRKPSRRARTREETITHPEAEGDYSPNQTVI
jgi:hypothetical protein